MTKDQKTFLIGIGVGALVTMTLLSKRTLMLELTREQAEALLKDPDICIHTRHMMGKFAVRVLPEGMSTPVRFFS